MSRDCKKDHVFYIFHLEALYHSVVCGLAGDNYPSCCAHSVRCEFTRGMRGGLGSA